MGEQQGVPWLIMLRGTQQRLYPARIEFGVGRKGLAETFFEVDLPQLTRDNAGYIDLIFSAAALEENGTAYEILKSSAQYAVELGERLRDKVYEEIIPDLSLAIADALIERDYEMDAEGLDLAYQMTLRVFFRMLFQVYAEDRKLLPYGENTKYDRNAIKTMAKDFVGQYLAQLQAGNLPCYEISDVVKRHIRTTGFTVTKKIATALKFPKEPIENREDCYDFEHKSKTALYEQVIAMGYKPVMINTDLKQSALWDEGVRGHLNLKGKHEQVFPPLPKGITQLNNNSLLDRIAIKHKSDKSSRFHNYAVKYDRILSSYRETFTSILEIGVAQGQSVSMWADYFVKATIHGADISQASESCVDYSKRIKFHLLDQRNLAQLKNMEQFSPFDLIIDDGNHYWMEQVLTFETLFNYLKSGGIYIVEDTTTTYWNEYRNSKISPVEYFKKFADYVHLSGQRGKTPSNPPSEFKDWEKGWHRREDCHVNVPLFDSVQFYNGFIVITKA
jgi:hypothetical protein